MTSSTNMTLNNIYYIKDLQPAFYVLLNSLFILILNNTGHRHSTVTNTVEEKVRLQDDINYCLYVDLLDYVYVGTFWYK